MDKITLVLMLAVTAEALVEYTKSLVTAFTGGDYKAAVLQLCAAIVAVLLCCLLYTSERLVLQVGETVLGEVVLNSLNSLTRQRGGLDLVMA